MNTKKIAVWISILASLGGIFAYARARDMDLKTVEIRQDQVREDIHEIKEGIKDLNEKFYRILQKE